MINQADETNIQAILIKYQSEDTYTSWSTLVNTEKLTSTEAKNEARVDHRFF